MRETESHDNEINTLNLLFPNMDTEAVRFVGHQINVIDNMGRGLMTLAGILLAITAAILSTPQIISLQRIFIIIGSSLVLLSVLINAWFVFQVKWITNVSSNNVDVFALKAAALSIRDRKTKGYHIALAAVIAGLVFYLLSLYTYWV
jgi:hypothetical protein